jgi:hypothetical protein
LQGNTGGHLPVCAIIFLVCGVFDHGLNSALNQWAEGCIPVAHLFQFLSDPIVMGFGEVAGCLGFRVSRTVWSERYRCSVNPEQYTAGQNPGRLLRWFDPRSDDALHAVNPL